MKFFLLKMNLYGIKNIDKEIEINFYKSTLKKIDTSNSHVKAIYGENGAGKTGIIYAVDIYKDLVLDPDYLTVCNVNGSLDCLINQNTQEFKIQMFFMCMHESGVNKVFSHLIRIKKLDKKFKIVEERLSELSGMNLNDDSKYTTIYHIVDGSICELHKKCNCEEELKMSTMNLLSTQSFVCAALKPRIINKEDLIGKEPLMSSAFLVAFVGSIIVVLQGSDRFVDYHDMWDQINSIMKQQMADDNGAISSNTFFGERLSYLDMERVHKSRYEQYEKYISNLRAFIKVFNNDLVDIQIAKDENGDFYECDNIMIYSNKRISKKFESTGIKKLINLYSALCELDNGKIIFIDEFDANIHDVLLEKLVLYIMTYSQGQFIFTTHNLGPMDVLQSAKNSIDFLSSDSRIVSWVKNGNYTAASQYRKGLIKYSPFNIEPFSFLGVFGAEKK